MLHDHTSRLEWLIHPPIPTLLFLMLRILYETVVGKFLGLEGTSSKQNLLNAMMYLRLFANVFSSTDPK